MIVLGHEEKVIKDWKYAEIGQGENSLGKSLTVTNKRIIVTERSEFTIDRNEIPLNKIAGVNTHYSAMTVDKKKQGIIFLILGIILSVLSIVVAVTTEVYGLLAALVFGLILIAMGIYFLLYKRTYGDLSVIFQTTIPIYTVRYGLSAAALPETLPENSAKEIRIQVDLTMARDIVETIGAIIISK